MSPELVETCLIPSAPIRHLLLTLIIHSSTVVHWLLTHSSSIGDWFIHANAATPGGAHLLRHPSLIIHWLIRHPTTAADVTHWLHHTPLGAHWFIHHPTGSTNVVHWLHHPSLIAHWFLHRPTGLAQWLGSVISAFVVLPTVIVGAQSLSVHWLMAHTPLTVH